MVSLKVVRSRNAALVKSQPLVAVFVGGTAGIGSYAVRALAAHAKDGPGLRLYLVGRKKAAAEQLIADCLKLCPTGQFHFVQTDDLALLKSVDGVCAEITRLEQEACTAGETPRIDFLVMTQGYLAFEERKETKEGLDALMSLLYYSRARFTTQLLPLLLASSLPAHVVSVFGPQRDNKLFTDDVSLRNPKNYGFGNMGSHVAYLTTFFMEDLAAKHPGRLSLTHYFPGVVVTDSFKDERLPAWFKYAWKYLIAPFSWLFSVPQAECGERVVFLASDRFPARSATGAAPAGSSSSAAAGEVVPSSDGVLGGGAYKIDWNGEIFPTKKSYKKLREEGMAEKFRTHTMRVFEDIEAGKVFTG